MCAGIMVRAHTTVQSFYGYTFTQIGLLFSVCFVCFVCLFVCFLRIQILRIKYVYKYYESNMCTWIGIPKCPFKASVTKEPKRHCLRLQFLLTPLQEQYLNWKSSSGKL